MKVHTYLNYGGNCEQAFHFYEEHLGAKIMMLMKHGEEPGGPQNPGLSGVLHARLQLGDTFISGADVSAERWQPMRSAYIALAVDSNEEAERIHAVLKEGGDVFMPMAETFFAHRFSMLRDRFGTSWMIIHERPMPENQG
jgi:PhnB protein